MMRPDYEGFLFQNPDFGLTKFKEPTPTYVFDLETEIVEGAGVSATLVDGMGETAIRKEIVNSLMSDRWWSTSFDKRQGVVRYKARAIDGLPTETAVATFLETEFFRDAVSSMVTDRAPSIRRIISHWDRLRDSLEDIEDDDYGASDVGWWGRIKWTRSRYMQGFIVSAFADLIWSGLSKIVPANADRLTAQIDRIILEEAAWDFWYSADRFRTAFPIYSNLRGQLNQIYATNRRVGLDGIVDDGKAVARIAQFLRREAIPGTSDKFGAERLARSLCALCRGDKRSVVTSVDASGIEFEKNVEKLFASCGYKASRTPSSGDFGADVIAEKGDLRYAVQCKHHARPVGIKAVQEAATARRYHKCDFAVVVSDSGFTPAAQELALEVDVVCVSSIHIEIVEKLALRLN